MKALPAGAEGLVLDAAKQRSLLDGIRDLAGHLPGDRQIAEEAAMVAFVFDAVLLDMAKRGLREERDALLVAHFGSERAAWHFGYVREWNPALLTSSAHTRHTDISRRRSREREPGTDEPISRFFKLSGTGVCNT